MYSVHDVYKYNKDNTLKMLSDYTGEFWDEYRTNYQKYDKVFDRMFMSFRYCFQNDEEEVNDVANNFREDVYNHLLMNDKKYSELYRVHVIPDTNYSLTDNYDVTETMDRDGTDNSDNYYGARTDTIEEVEGSRTDSTSETEGSRTDSRELDTGSQTDDTTHKVAPYDSSDFSNNSKDEEVKGARHDEEETIKGQQINSGSLTKGSQTNNTSNIKGSQTDELERTYTEDYTLHRKGNIGVMTVSDMLKKHKDFWNAWEFYEYIFKEICKELLLI